MSDNIASAAAKDETVVVEKKRHPRSKKQNQVVEPSFNMAELRKLAALVVEHGFTDVEFENENIRVRLSKTSTATVYSAPASASAHAPASTQNAPANAPEAAAAPPAVDPDAGLHKITSPIVGTFYRSPGPDKDSFV
ncbi:MAG: hypothetical protein ABIV21_05475, partial [Pyrinomonadaceae bacterium]